jgi:hypothetical protein
VVPTMGVTRPCGMRRRRAVVSRPSICGICQSIRTRL